ncbi:unnamed protein product [Chilo suppressalis]|uniref:Uncharacterized protein n=1 Tax=Chilo suppressalis TaxID=168631 RepID=A0ABN8BB34_CHISP|nr:unnamed protein product [Chilo suppressalis]
MSFSKFEGIFTPELIAVMQGFCDVLNPEEWFWSDDIIQNDFNRLKFDQKTEITANILLLKTFYVYYFGATSQPQDVGQLFSNILLTAPDFNNTETKLVNLSSTCENEFTIPTYITSPDLENQFENLLKSCSNSFDDFREDMKKAFESIIGKETSIDYNNESLLALHCTAVFLIFVMIRRITKSELDLKAAFSSRHLQKVYYQMVPYPFGSTIPSPSEPLNRVLTNVLRFNESGKQFLVLIFGLMLQNMTSTDKQKSMKLDEILKVACMNHLAGTGLQLITLFEKFKILYGLSNEQALELIDNQFWGKSKDIIIRIRSLQDQAFEKTGVTHILFPYCRLVDERYHRNLGYRGNEHQCYLLAQLIDLHSPPKSRNFGASSASWTNKLSPIMKINVATTAQKIYTFLKKPH